MAGLGHEPSFVNDRFRTRPLAAGTFRNSSEQVDNQCPYGDVRVASKKKQGNRPHKDGPSGPVDGFRNRVRGAVAAFKRLPVGLKAEQRWTSEQRAVGVLNRALNDARRKLPSSELKSFEAWADGFMKAQLQAHAIGTSPALLGVLPTKPAPVTLASAVDFHPKLTPEGAA